MMPSIRAGSAFIAAALLLAPFTSSATPLYYVFQGHVIHSTVPSHALGSSVDYTFLVDRDQDGATIDESGNLSDIPDFFEEIDWYTLSFHASYVGGSALDFDNPASPFKQSCFCGVEQRHYEEKFSALRGSNSDRRGFDLIDIWSTDLGFPDWHVGQSLLAENFITNAPGELNSTYSSALTLTAIEDYNPIAMIPEPSTFASFGLGFLGLGALFMKRKHRGI
ncbi:MAG: PEP-CTERM sorting domain-containing protein [Fibrobacterota bacterium]|nr:PEP-CTERM sorting domain-containing protein [Fibrobacterota bacterium]